jgi:hypothetical protein
MDLISNRREIPQLKQALIDITAAEDAERRWAEQEYWNSGQASRDIYNKSVPPIPIVSELGEGVLTGLQAPGNVARGLIGNIFGGNPNWEPPVVEAGRQYWQEPSLSGLPGGIASGLYDAYTDPTTYSGIGAISKAKQLQAAAQKLAKIKPAASEFPHAGYLSVPRRPAFHELLDTMQDVPPVTPTGTMPSMPAKPLGLPAPQPLFYSRLDKAAELLPEKVKAESLKNTLKKIAPEGVSDDEMNWVLRGLPTKGVLSKDQVLKHIDENRVDVKIGALKRENALYGHHAQDLHTRQNYRETLAGIQEIPYYEPHWRRAGILAHSRQQDIPLPEGGVKRQLMEIQSQLHEDAAKRGYSTNYEPGLYWRRPKDAPHLLETEIATNQSPGTKKIWIEKIDPDGTVEVIDEYSEILGQFNSEHDAKIWAEHWFFPDRPLPDAPFKDEKAWTSLMLRKALHEAAQDPRVKAFEVLGGEEVERLVHGKLAGQQRYYDKVVPIELQKTLGKLGAGEIEPKFSKIPSERVRGNLGNTPSSPPALEAAEALLAEANELDMTLDQIQRLKEQGFTHEQLRGHQQIAFPRDQNLIDRIRLLNYSSRPRFWTSEALRAMARDLAGVPKHIKSGVQVEMTPELRSAILKKSWPLLSLPVAGASLNE